ncbi:MAG: DUF6290 family protein [Mariprofundales bacterium]
MLTLELNDDLERSLHNEAEREGISLADLARRALQSYLADREDYDQGIKALQRIQSGEEKTIPLDQLQRELEG